MVERIQYNVQSNAINLTKLNYSATTIVHIYRNINSINLFTTSYKHKFNA